MCTPVAVFWLSVVCVCLMSSGVCCSTGTPVVVWCVYSSGCVVVECVCVCLMSSGVCSAGTPVIVLWLTVCSAVISISLSLSV